MQHYVIMFVKDLRQVGNNGKALLVAHDPLSKSWVDPPVMAKSAVNWSSNQSYVEFWKAVPYDDIGFLNRDAKT